MRLRKDEADVWTYHPPRRPYRCPRCLHRYFHDRAIGTERRFECCSCGLTWRWSYLGNWRMKLEIL